MALYESAIRCVAMRLNIMEKEADTTGKHNPSRPISSCIKQPLSINRKLRNRGGRSQRNPLWRTCMMWRECGSSASI